ncbi:MAG: hypothetical protein NTZ63_01295 [Candidatus Omnitrophica bacterium]|nr:hypothetical protein [Candidatus Omnitrophota bacterium]
MDKKDIYEHLAKIYLDASSKKKKKNKAYPRLFKNLFIISIFLVVGLGSTLATSLFKKNGLSSEIALVLQNDASKINFNFNPAKKETFTINLNKLNVGRFKSLAFAVKNVHPSEKISLRVEFTNAFKEKSEIYVKDLSGKWQDYKINLSEFKTIRDWSELSSLTFSVEEWNATAKSGVLYIDNIRLLK